PDCCEAQAALVQYLCSKTLFLAQQAEQQMLRADVFVRQALSFLRRIGEYALALVGKREVDRSGDLFTHCGVLFDLLPDGLYGRVRAEKAVGKRFVLAQQTEQEVFGFNVGRAKLTRLGAR